jgi:hypothetical protein
MCGIWDDALISEAWKQRENRGEVRVDILRLDVSLLYSVFVQLHNVQHLAVTSQKAVSLQSTVWHYLRKNYSFFWEKYETNKYTVWGEMQNFNGGGNWSGPARDLWALPAG